MDSKKTADAMIAASAGIMSAAPKYDLLTAVKRLIKAKGRFHTEQNYTDLVAAYDDFVLSASETIQANVPPASDWCPECHARESTPEAAPAVQPRLHQALALLEGADVTPMALGAAREILRDLTAGDEVLPAVQRPALSDADIRTITARASLWASAEHANAKSLGSGGPALDARVDKAEKEFLAALNRIAAAHPAPVTQPAQPVAALPIDRGDFVESICVSIAEIPDRDSPEDQPEMMLVTYQELKTAIESAFENHDELMALAAPTPQSIAAQPVADADKYRAQGRAEALAILMTLDPEGGIDDYIGWSASSAPEDEGNAFWDDAKLRELLHVDSELADMMNKAEAEYYDYQGHKDEADRAHAFAVNMHSSGKIREVLSKAGEFELMAQLCTDGAPTPQDSRDALDAARWRAMLGSARIRMLGSAGLRKPEPNNYAHFGMEIWTVYGGSLNPEQREQMAAGNVLGIEWLTKYADIAIASTATKEPQA